MLKENVIKTIREMREFQGNSAEFKGGMSLNRGAERVLKGHEELEESLINLVKGMRGGGQPLNAPVLRAVLEGVVEVKAPQLLRSNGGPWGLSENWVKEWIRSKLGWSFWVATTAAQKLPKDWEHQLDMMAYRAVFEMLTHGVPAELMVNMDQTVMHLVPSGGEPDVRQAGQEGDRSDGSRRQASDYHLRELSCRRNNASSSANLPGKELSQPSKWPHGCTSKGQPADVIQQKPLKAGIKRGFDLYTAGQVAKQIADGVPPSEVHLDLRMETLREEIVKWAKESFHSLMGRQDMVRKGWKKCGLLRVFDPEFQKEALKLVADGTIAKPGAIERPVSSMIRMQKLEALMEAVEGAYFVQSNQVASSRAGPGELNSAATVRRGRAAAGTPPRDAAGPSASV
ncbi:unnamed protein product [Sphagnum jensenii]